MGKINPLDKRILVARAVESYCKGLLEDEEGEEERAEYNILVSVLKKTEKFVKKKKGKFSTDLEKMSQKQWKKRFKDDVEPDAEGDGEGPDADAHS